MKKKISICIFSIAILLYSCTSDYSLRLTVDNAAGINKNTLVMLRGVEVGRVKGVTIENGDPIVIISMDDNYQIPVNSVFKITNKNILGSKVIHVEVSDNKEVISPNAKIRSIEERSFDLDSLLRSIDNKVSEIGDTLINLNKRSLD